MSEFDKEFEKVSGVKFPLGSGYYSAFSCGCEAGQQSQQAKIDELKQHIVMQDLFYDQSAEIKNLKLKLDELQKHSLMLRETAKSWSYNESEKNILISQADDLDRILKGNKDD